MYILKAQGETYNLMQGQTFAFPQPISTPIPAAAAKFSPLMQFSLQIRLALIPANNALLLLR